MATFTEQTQPYEFLIRWGKDGNIQGAHVGFRILTFRDGVEIADTPQPVMPVAIGVTQGYPLADILNKVQITALADREAVIADRNAVMEAMKAISEQAAATIAERDAEIARLQSLQSAAP